MLNISNDNEKYLARDETIKKEFKLKDQDVLTSSNRLFIKNDKNIKYIEYANISGLELMVQRHYLIISIGLMLIACTLNLQQFDPPGWVYGSLPGRLMWGYGDGGSTYIIIGTVLTLIGFLWKTLSIKVKVTSSNDEIALAGDKKTVSALFRVVNERRMQAHSSSR